MGNHVCVYFAKTLPFIGKLKDFGVRRLKLRVHDLNIWNQIFNL